MRFGHEYALRQGGEIGILRSAFTRLARTNLRQAYKLSERGYAFLELGGGENVPVNIASLIYVGHREANPEAETGVQTPASSESTKATWMAYLRRLWRIVCER